MEPIPLDPNKHKAEYDAIKTNFMATIGNANSVIHGIKRIQNRELYERYFHWKQTIIKKYKKLRENGVVIADYYEEQMLYHGTRSLDPKEIYISKEGIDRRYTNAGVAFGIGSYFAVNASYSAGGGYVHTLANGTKKFLYCRVFPGVITLKANLEKNYSLPKINDSLTQAYAQLPGMGLSKLKLR